MINFIKNISFALITSLLIVACGKKQDPQPKGPPAMPVTSYTVKKENAVYYDDYPAVVVALNQVELRPEVSGLITGIYFKDGSHVRKGMKLYSIDEQQYRAAYEQALANLSVAKSNLNKAQQDAKRYNELAEKDAIARQQLEHAQADLQAAQSQVKAAEANVSGVQTNLRYATITAPFDGTIGISSVKLGSSVVAGQTLLNTISTDSPMAVDLQVDEKQIGRYTELLNRKPDPNDSTFTLLLPDKTLYPQTGHLSLLDRAVDPQTGTIRARVIFPNPKGILRSGLTVDLRVMNSSASGSILIPARASTEQMGEYFVYVINGNKVKQQKIDMGVNIGDMAVVKGGLKAGDEIVLDGIQRLKDNSTIRVVPPQQMGSNAGQPGGQQSTGRNQPGRNQTGSDKPGSQTSPQGTNETGGKMKSSPAPQKQGVPQSGGSVNSRDSR
ncbi:MAG TPA: efflux RND transporter periplasmic adaptor subunit [Ignavibacteriales bacterium]|nr:efflux RND transporter periplasmic adaptor subunit [Ignavibacteriales bacterium]